MSANQIHRPRIPEDETKSRALKASSTASEGLYKPGFPHGLVLPGTLPAGASGTEAGGRFAGGSDADDPHKGKNLDLYA